MRLAFQYTFKPNFIQKEIIEDIMWHCEKVYNTLNYDIYQGKEKISLEKSLNIQSSKIYKKYREENWHSKYLHSHTLLEIILNCVSDHKSYLALKEKYNNKDKNIKGKPKKPKYKNLGKIQITFTKYAIRQEGNILKLSISKEMQEKFKVKSLNFLIPKKLKKLVNFSAIKMIKVRKDKENKYKMEMIYEKEEKAKEGTNVMAIDLGLNNLATCTNMNNNETLIIAGESIKSKIGYYNKEIQRLERIQMKMIGSKKYKNTKQIEKKYIKRRQYCNTYMHKASRMIVNYAIENECDRIVIGDIKNIKQEMKKNKRFVEVPIQKLVEKVKYKAELEGKEVILIEESYTSGVSSIDKEEINKENYKKARRIKRGLFKTNAGKIINSDINGSLNILRKYVKSFSPNLEIAMDIGREQRPLKKRVA